MSEEPMTNQHPCGHVEMVLGCGGCDPGAIEWVIPDGGTLVRFDPERDMVAPPQPEEAASGNGLDLGDIVTIGGSSKQWVISEFWLGPPNDGTPNREQLARLEPVDGYTGTSVRVDRLRKVEQA